MRIRACFASSVPILEPRALISFRMRLELDPDLTPDYRQVGVVPGRFAEVSDGAHEHERGRPAVGTVLAAQPASILVEVPPSQVFMGDPCFNFFPGVNAHDLLLSRRAMRPLPGQLARLPSLATLSMSPCPPYSESRPLGGQLDSSQVHVGRDVKNGAVFAPAAVGRR